MGFRLIHRRRRPYNDHSVSSELEYVASAPSYAFHEQLHVTIDRKSYDLGSLTTYFW